MLLPSFNFGKLNLAQILKSVFTIRQNIFHYIFLCSCLNFKKNEVAVFYWDGDAINMASHCEKCTKAKEICPTE